MAAVLSQFDTIAILCYLTSIVAFKLLGGETRDFVTVGLWMLGQVSVRRNTRVCVSGSCNSQRRRQATSIFGTLESFRRENSRLPINIAHFSERVGLFVMLMLGESIISLLDPPLTRDPEHYIVVVTGFMCVLRRY